MVEQPGRWGHDALVESELPAHVGRELGERGRAAGVRVLLIKQRRAARTRRRCYLAYTGTRERHLRVIGFDDPEELLSLDVGGLAERRFIDVGEPVDEPMFLVCTHGKHDQCCARNGTPLFRELEVPNAWESTHIGGDRFAGNLVCFPHGLYYGRVMPSEGTHIATEYARGRVVLDRLRGRSAYSPPVQAAEIELRRRLELSGVDDLQLVAHQGGGERHRVTFRDRSGGEHHVEVRVKELEERRLTCKATHPHRPRAFDVTPRLDVDASALDGEDPT
jgi:hypothetical protein